MIAQLNYVLKALLASASAAIGAGIAATVDASAITQNEWWVIAGAAVGTFAATYITPNTVKK